MNILMVTMSMQIGGAETHVLELSRALMKMGHRVTVASKDGVYVEALREAGIPHVDLPLHTKNPLAVLRSYRGLKELIRREKFDIVHAHARIPAFICGLLRRKLGFRLVTTVHFAFRVTPLWRKWSCWGEKTLAVSEDLREYVCENYDVASDNVSLIMNGIDTEKFSEHTDTSAIKAELNLSDDARRILCVSRMGKDMSLPAILLCRIAPRLWKALGRTEILLVGDGNDMDTVRAEAEAANREIGAECIKIMGARTDIPQIMPLADVFVGISRSALEAMACSKPVILAGNFGYGGIMTTDMLEEEIRVNFCRCGTEMPTEEPLFQDLCTLFRLTPAERHVIGEVNRGIVKEYYSTEKMAESCLAVYDKLLPYTPYKHGEVVISGYYGYRNMGDDSLLSVIIEQLRAEKPDVTITALTGNPKSMELRFGVKCVHRYNPFAVVRALRHAKLLISGGGSLLQDGTSTKSLCYYTAVMALARRLKTKVMIYGNGIGPLYREKNRRLAARAVERADAVTLRDPVSLKTLTEMGIDPEKPVVTADPAFLMSEADPARMARLYERAGITDATRFFLVSLRSDHNLDESSDGRLGEEFLNRMSAICRAIKEKYGLLPVLVPMQKAYDLEICRAVARDSGGVTVEGITAKELSGLVVGSEFVLGMRLHIIVYAAACGIPPVAISYDPKIAAMMEHLGERHLVSVFDAEEATVLPMVDDIIANRPAYRAHLARRAVELRHAAKQDVQTAIRLLNRS